MSLQKEYITRSVFDRRTSLDRRTINLGEKYPGQEQRTGRNRRRRWEKRNEWKPINQWSSSPIQFRLPDINTASWRIESVSGQGMSYNHNQE